MNTTSLTRLSLLSVLLTGACFAAPVVLAETHDHAAMMETNSPTEPSKWLTQAEAAYPLETCVVSGDKLEGGMGGPIDYIHKEAGQPDRLVRFCCKDCIKDFKKDPAKYLKKIDAAATAKTGHAEHMK